MLININIISNILVFLNALLITYTDFFLCEHMTVRNWINETLGTIARINYSVRNYIIH